MAPSSKMKDQVAIVGIGATPYTRAMVATPLALGLEAAKLAIHDAGIDRRDINGICGGSTEIRRGGPGHMAVQEGLGLGEITWCLDASLGACVIHTAQAIFAGACDTALVVQAYMRYTFMSASARNDLFLGRAGDAGATGASRQTVGGDLAERWAGTAESYAAWGQRYMHEYEAPREVLGMIAVNNRTNAARNEAAALRTPITMDEYLNARMIREPLGLLDCDYPVNCAEAMVLTTAERARDLARKPVYIHASSFGQTASGSSYYEGARSWTATAPWVAMRAMWPRSDIQIDDIDLFFPYDGFTPIALAWTEAAGFCKPGEAYDLYRSSWLEDENRLKLGGRTYMSTNGGSMSHGRMGGFNYFTESVKQLRGEAGDHQVPGVKTSLLGIGSYYHDPIATVLRAA